MDCFGTGADAVQGAQNLLTLAAGFQGPAWETRVRFNVANAAAPVLHAYRTIADEARAAGRLTADADADLVDAIDSADQIVTMLREEPMPQLDWNEGLELLVEAITITKRTLGFAAQAK